MSITLPQTPPSAAIGATRLFLLAILCTGLWLGLNAALPGLQATGIPSIMIRLTIHAAILIGLWVAITQTELAGRTRVKVWLAIAIPFTAWLGIVWWLAIADVFRPRPGAPTLPIAILLPLLVALPFLLRSQHIGSVLAATPPSWLVGLQVYRIFGGIFLVSWSRGAISGTFAMPAGMGDILVGVLALPVAYLLRADTPNARRIAIAWNILGLVDFAVAVGIGLLSAPGPLQVIVPDRPNVQLGTFPTVMIPAFAVPSSILLHVLSLRQLRRLGASQPKTHATSA